MKNTLLISIIFFFISCHNYKEEDYKNNCNQRCEDERICIDAKCQCPPDTYPFRYKCVKKDSANMYHAFLENNIMACDKEAVIYAYRLDTTSYNAPPFKMYFYEGYSSHFSSYFKKNSYIKKIDGDSFHCDVGEASFTLASNLCQDKYYSRYSRMSAKFRGEDTLDVLFHFLDWDFIIKDSARVIFTRND